MILYMSSCYCHLQHDTLSLLHVPDSCWQKTQLQILDKPFCFRQSSLGRQRGGGTYKQKNTMMTVVRYVYDHVKGRGQLLVERQEAVTDGLAPNMENTMR